VIDPERHPFWPVGHTHDPLVHVPPTQLAPQAPQLLLSVSVLTHVPPQFVSPIVHPVQTPDEHTWPDAHAIVHEPQ